MCDGAAWSGVLLGLILMGPWMLLLLWDEIEFWRSRKEHERAKASIAAWRAEVEAILNKEK